jgi:hypothetical protein
MKKIIISAIITVSVAFSEQFPIMETLVESGSITNITFFGTGAAFPTNSSGMSLNPAVPMAWHHYSKSRASVSGIYINNRGEDFYRTGGGASFVLGKGNYVGAEYNIKSEGPDKQKFHRGTIAYGATIDDFEDKPLFVGANVSYFNFNGNLSKSGILPVKKDTVFNKTTAPARRDTSYNSDVHSVKALHNVVSTDLGFYQPGEAKGISWGIVLENILGYSWSNNNPYIETENDSAYYVFSDKKTNGILNKKYNSFLLGANLSLPIMDDNLLLMVPFDLRFWGFMNKDLRKSTRLKHRLETHSGFELQFGGKVCGRFGWAWVPKNYDTDESGQLDFKNWEHHFSGGFGVSIKMFLADMYFTKDAIGVGLSVRL